MCVCVCVCVCVRVRVRVCVVCVCCVCVRAYTKYDVWSYNRASMKKLRDLIKIV